MEKVLLMLEVNRLHLEDQKYLLIKVVLCRTTLVKNKVQQDFRKELNLLKVIRIKIIKTIKRNPSFRETITE